MLHYVASQAEKSNPELLSLPEELAVLEDASKTSLEQLRSEVTQLDNQIKKIQNQMEAPNTQADVKVSNKNLIFYDTLYLKGPILDKVESELCSAKNAPSLTSVIRIYPDFKNR